MYNSRNWHRKRKAYLVAYKGGKCIDCGQVFPACCFDFDHRNPFDKVFSISSESARGRLTLSEIEKEADKCDLVCANCHRIRTYGNVDISEKMRRGMKGQIPWNKGKKKPYSAETLQKMSESQTKRFEWDTPPNSGKVWTEQEKQQMSEAMKSKGIKPSTEACRLGGQRAAETRKRLRENK